MYYSYVEIEYIATSFSPARTDLALKLLKAHSVARLFWYYFGTISSTTNSTKIVPETSEKMAFLEEVSGIILGTFCGTISLM
jgi:hypothetical protein